MSKQINQYTKERFGSQVSNFDLLDLDSTDDGGSTYESAKVTAKVFADYIGDYLGIPQSTLYSTDGLITNDRTVTTFNSVNQFLKWVKIDNIVQSDDIERGYKVEKLNGLVRAYLSHDTSADSGKLSLSDANGEFFNASEGKVRIGTSSLFARLHVKGSGNGPGTNSLFIENSDGDALLIAKDDGAIGIGTTAPNAKLHVKGTGATSATTNFLLQNSLNDDILKVTDDGNIDMLFGDDAAALFGSGKKLGIVKKSGWDSFITVGSSSDFIVKKWNQATITDVTSGVFDSSILRIETDVNILAGVNKQAFIVNDTSDDNAVDPPDNAVQFQINTRSKTSISTDTLGRTTLGGTNTNRDVILNTNDSIHTGAGIQIKQITADELVALSAANGMIAYVTDTNATISSIGFWGYENGNWVKL